MLGHRLDLTISKVFPTWLILRSFPPFPGHAAWLWPGVYLLQHRHFPHLLRLLCADSPVCPGERGDRSAHEALGGEQQGGKGGGRARSRTGDGDEDHQPWPAQPLGHLCVERHHWWRETREPPRIYQSHANQGGFSALTSLSYGENLGWRVRRAWLAFLLGEDLHELVMKEVCTRCPGLVFPTVCCWLLHGLEANAAGKRPQAGLQTTLMHLFGGREFGNLLWRSAQATEFRASSKFTLIQSFDWSFVIAKSWV